MSFSLTGFADPAGVLFVEDFDEEAITLVEAVPEIAEPVLTAEDVEEAREEGRRAGAEEARGEEAAIQAALCSAALAAIGDGLSAARADAAAVAERRAEDIAGAVLALLGAALPATASRLAPQEVSALLAALLPPLSHTPEVRLRVHPSVLDSLAAQLAGFAGVAVEADAALSPCDVALSWQDGEARRDWAALWAQLGAALAPFHLPAAPAQDNGG